MKEISKSKHESKEFQDLSNEFIKSIYQMALASGSLKVVGKSETEIKAEFEDYMIFF